MQYEKLTCGTNIGRDGRSGFEAMKWREMAIRRRRRRNLLNIKGWRNIRLKKDLIEH